MGGGGGAAIWLATQARAVNAVTSMKWSVMVGIRNGKVEELTRDEDGKTGRGGQRKLEVESAARAPAEGAWN